MKLSDISYKNFVITTALISAFGIGSVHFFSTSAHSNVFLIFKKIYFINSQATLQAQFKKEIKVTIADIKSTLTVVVSGALYGALIGTAAYSLLQLTNRVKAEFQV